MPYARNSDLPAEVRRLPAGAQTIFRGAVNGALKSYAGDESRAFATAWAAVKRKYKKDGNRWVLKQEEERPMGLLEILRALHADYRRTAPGRDEAGLASAAQLFVQVEAEPEANGRLLTYLDQYVVPALGFEQAYYNLNTPNTEHLNDFPGSLNHRLRVVCCAAREDRENLLGRGGFVMAVYPDSIVACFREGYSYYDYDSSREPAETYWQIPYTYDEASGDVEFGERTQVEVRTVVLPAAEVEVEVEVETSEGETAEQATATAPTTAIQFVQRAAESDAAPAPIAKVENGQAFGPAAFLIVGDIAQAETWAVRVEEAPGKVTVAQLGRAYAALAKGKVAASPAQIEQATKKLKAAYKKAGAPYPGTKVKKQAAEEFPDWLLQGEDPPGGEEDLVQTLTVRLEQEGDVGADGVMYIQGVATVGNVVSKNDEVYPTQVWEDNLPRLQELIEQGRLLGESDHPEDGRSTLKNTALQFTSIWQDGDQFRFKAKILPTIPDGQNLQILLKNGVAVDLSSRGKGRMAQGTWGGKTVKIVQRGFRVDAFDAVLNGASPGSTVTDFSMAQAAGEQSPTVNQEEIEMGEATKILEAIQGLTAKIGEQDKVIAGLVQAQSGAAPAATATQGMSGAEADAAVAATTGGAQLTMSADVLAQIEKSAMTSRLQDAIDELKLKGWGPQWINVLRKQIVDAAPTNLTALETAIQARVKLVEDMIGAAPGFPGMGFQVQKSKGERGPQTPNEVIEALVSGLPDIDDDDPMAFMRQDADGRSIAPPDWVKSPKRQCRKILQNLACLQENGFDGRAAIHNLMRLEQGYSPIQDREAFLNQVCADGTTSVAAGGAPTSAIYIFPLVRRAFPQLIAGELASVQPMDRPSGKIFYLDAYRISPTTSETDESGSVSSSRMRIDRSESFDPDYSDRAAECDTAALIQLHLSSRSVDAESKALHAVWTIENVQDLRAYHGLDVQTELMGATARQIALEWNQTILNEMLAGATAGNSIYGTTAPSGYTAKEWEEYLPRYLDLASTNIFQKRHGDMTHIIAGPTAWLRLAAAFRAGTKPESANPEMFAGLTLTPFMTGSMSNVKTYKTSFWSVQNTDKILVIRRGADWSDTPYVWAPYATYMSPTLTLPDVFTQKQGLLDRAAHKVVVGDAMSTITINGSTGVPVGG